MTRSNARRKASQGMARMRGNSACKKRKLLPHGHATLQQEGADLIDDTRALTHQRWRTR